MSLLLDALKTRESSAPPSAESSEEALDGREALKILTAKMEADTALTLEAGPVDMADVESAAPGSSSVPPRESATASRNPPMGRAVAAALPSGLPPALSPAAPLAASPVRRYAAMLAAAVAVVIVVMLGKSLLHRNSNQISYPAPAESPQAAAGQPAARSNPSAVQVPTRPPSQFSGVGGAPEIDLHENLVTPAAIRAPLGPVARTIRPDASASEAAASSPSMLPRRSFSVAPSAGVASVDKHIETGYRALASGNIATAQSEYHAALDLDPNNVDALLGTASAASRAGNPTLAAAAYAKVLRLEPGNQDATAALTILNHDPTATEANESRLKVMIASDNERRPALHAALAGVYSADGRWADAAQEYFIALSMDPGDSDLAFNLAASLDQNHNAAAALTYYAQALAFAKLRRAQIDTRAIEERISQLQARIEVRPATPRAAP
jgi:Tfp pilus assembly protein PilF